MKATDLKKHIELETIKYKQQKQEKYNEYFIAEVKNCVANNREINGIVQLIEAKADINATDKNGDNALLIVLKGQEPIRTDILKFLLSSPKNIIIQDNFDTRRQKTTLECAAEIENHHDALLICKRLVKKGAVIYDEEKGINAIHFADEACNDRLVNFFESKLQEQVDILGSDSFFSDFTEN